MSGPRETLQTVNLENCHREQIQTPGSIQPHGVLLALALDGTLTHESRNARTLFPDLPALGERPTETLLWRSRALRKAAEGMIEDASVHGGGAPALAVQLGILGERFDVILHIHAGRLLLEFEPQVIDSDAHGSFAVLAHRSMSRLKHLTSVDAILEEAVTSIRALTGFDRVMAYRFQQDNSGEVVVEAKTDALAPYAGRRLPSADILAQARRLYILNTLRSIADVSDQQIVRCRRMTSNGSYSECVDCSSEMALRSKIA